MESSQLEAIRIRLSRAAENLFHAAHAVNQENAPCIDKLAMVVAHLETLQQQERPQSLSNLLVEPVLAPATPEQSSLLTNVLLRKRTSPAVEESIQRAVEECTVDESAIEDYNQRHASLMSWLAERKDAFSAARQSIPTPDKVPSAQSAQLLRLLV